MNFPMPFIKSPEFAADKMFKGLTKSKGIRNSLSKSTNNVTFKNFLEFYLIKYIYF